MELTLSICLLSNKFEKLVSSNLYSVELLNDISSLIAFDKLNKL